MRISALKIAFAAAAGLVLCAHARSVSVAKLTDASVTFAFGAQDGNDYELIMAHGAQDSEDDKRGWTAFEKVADVAWDQTTCTYEVPEALRDGRYLRFFLMQRSNLPYAKELKSVSSTGLQWVNTGVAPNGRTVVDFRFGKITYSNQTAFFGQGWAGNQYLLNQQNRNGGQGFMFHSGGQDLGFVTANTDYRCLIDDDNKLYFSYNNITNTISIGRGVGSGSLAIFGCNTGRNLAAFSFYGMKIANDGNYQRNFIPALDANGVAGLYDQVGNLFYKSQTETPLVAGEEFEDDRFGRVVDSTPSFKFHRSISVVAQNDNTVVFAFGNPNGKAYKLYAAYGSYDRGRDKNAWDSFDEVATIAADATSYTYTLPAAIKAPGTFFRFFLLQTDDLPYAAELAYIVSDGSQTVRIGYIPGTDTMADFSFGNISYVNGTAFFGQGWTGNCYLFNQQNRNGGQGFMFHSGGQDIGFVAANTDYRCTIDSDNYITIANGLNYNAVAISRAACPIYEMAVFGCYSITKGTAYRFDSLLLKDNGLVVRDLVPVRTTDGKGALFDRANGEIWKNLTSVDFTKGAAVPRQGWPTASTESYKVAPGGAVGNATISGTIVLTEDTDWTGEQEKLVNGVTVDLNGHTLHLSAPETESILSPIVIKGSSGTLQLTVPAERTYNGDYLRFEGAVKILKDGSGTYFIQRKILAVTGITVAEGTVKYGNESVITLGIPIEVLDGGTFDMAGKGNGNVPFMRICGMGPDGKGALRNTGADVGNGSAQMAGLELTGDAGVYGTGHLGLINSGYAATTFELNGHTLTIDLTAGRGFWFCNTTGTTGGTVYTKGGIPYFHRNAVNIPNVDFVIDGATSIFRVPTGTVSSPVNIKSLTVKNGGSFEEGYQSTHMQDLILLDGALVPNTAVKWIYVSGTILVSNETSNVTIFPPLNGTAKLVKKGAATLTIANNHTDQRIDGGVEIFGGKVVMDSSASTRYPERAISSQPVPVIIHSGGTLDMTACGSSPFALSGLVIDEGGTLLHTAENVISFTRSPSFDKPQPFSFSGTVNFAAQANFLLGEFFAGANAPAAGTSITLLTAGAITANTGGGVNVVGCPYDYDIDVTPNAITLKTHSESATPPPAPIKIWPVGGNYVYGDSTTGDNFRYPLARLLAAEGWNVQMTGWRSTNPNGLQNANKAWCRHAGAIDLALKTSAGRAGILEGLETYAFAANEPDFTIFVCGDIDVTDNVGEATVLANYKAAVTRIKAALPMTTVIASTIPGASASLNNQITDWCASETDVECVDLAGAFASGITAASCDNAANILKAKLLTLATAEGKINPSTWTRPAVTLGAENNVPAEYLAGFTHVRTIEPTIYGYTQNPADIPYSYAPPMKTTGISKVGYYIELVRKDTGALQALWVDMDAPGTTWTDVSFPVTIAQQKQQVVTKLHVWSNSGGVTPVAANDDSVEGYIEFNPLNYNGNDTDTAGAISEPWSGNIYGFNDTFNTSGSNGHGCFQLMRKFSDATVFPQGEVLFAYNNWGKGTGDTQPRAIGIGTLADFGNLGYNTTKTFDRTFTCGEDGTDAGNISSPAYSLIHIGFWVKYADGAPSRAALADAVWSSTADAAFATAGNWTAGGGAATTLADSNLLIPENANQTFTYNGWDPISLPSSTLMVDGKATFPEVGGIYFAGLDMAQTGKLTFDPVKFSIRTVAPPTFAAGAKLALTSNYASFTKGRFLLMTWNNGTLDMTDAELNALFDATSASGADVKVWAENLAQGGRLWLDLDYTATKTRMNVLCVGDSITHGSDSTYGNWRIFLMKLLAAKGYAPVGKGHRFDQSHDICGATMPDEWIYHSGISGQRLITRNGGGTIDQIEATLDQAGDVDFVLVKLGTNDINSNGSRAEELFPVWKELVWKTLNQKPHAKFIAGAVVDIAYNAALDAQVVAFNTMMKNAAQDDTFPARRVYFADLYTPCYRYDQGGNYITGSFYDATNLHPDWPGEIKMAETYCAAIEGAMAEDASFVPGAAETDVPTSSGAENTLPRSFLNGLTRARVLDIAACNGMILSDYGIVPYSFKNDAAPVSDLSRVGYYIELKRRNNAQSDYHGLVRWLWVSMDAFGDRTLDDVGVPLFKYNQTVVRRMRVISNMPGIESTAAEATGVSGWVEFWPSSYSNGASGIEGAVAKAYGFDWNDTRSDNMSGYGAMQVHRFTPGAANSAQVLFSFNRWTTSGSWEIGLGNFSHQSLGSVDWTFTGDPGKGMTETMAADAYEVARIEIWTASMANDPDAPTAALVYVDGVEDDGDTATVTGTLADFGFGAESAKITLEWSDDPAFATIAGTADLGEIDELGKFSATATDLSSGKTWYFRFTSMNDKGKSAVSDNSDPLTLMAGYWRPQTTADVWTSIAWLKDGTGSPMAFNPVWTAVFDGQEPTKTATVNIPEEVSASKVVVQGSSDYVFDGAGAITSRRLVKEGSGNLTIEARALAGTPDIEIRAGVVKLGDSAVVGAAGSNGGTITVKSGGQFDFNHIDTTSGNNRARALITSGKTFVIEGEGPDGTGALTTTAQNEFWGSPINEVIMTGDATIGGVSRIDIRGNSKNSITGPADATLTIKNSAANRTRGLNVHGPISVGKMVIAEEGCYCPEGGGFTLNMPNGIELHGAFSMWAATGMWNVGGMVAVGDRAYIGNDNGTGYIRTPLTVSEGAKLTMGGGATTHYMETVTNRSEITVVNGNHYIYGDLVNEGNPVIRTGRNFFIYPRTVTGDSRIEASGGQTLLSGNSDWGDAALAVSLTGGGELVIGSNSDGYGMPKFGKNKLTVNAASGHTGTVYFHPSTSAAIDGITCYGTISKFFMQGPNVKTKNAGPIIAGYANDIVFTANNLEAGNGNGRGEWTITGANTHIAVKGLYSHWIGSDYYAGSFTFRDGILEIGSDGIKEAWTAPTRTAFNMESGTLRATDNFSIGKAGMRAFFGGPVKGGHVTFDLNGKSVKWGTGLAGASDVTLTGGGTFAPDRPGIQGIPLGKWTVDTTAPVDLRNAAGFAGGLSLAENTTATLDIAGTNMVEFLAWTWNGNAWNDMRPRFIANEPITPFVATSLTYLNRAASQITDVKYGSGSGFNYMGEFYVSAEQAGTWYFNYRAKTHHGVFIDDTELSTTGPDAEGTVSKDLSEGWHKFMISLYTGAANPQMGAYSGADCIKFKVGANGTYQVFDTTTVPMRMRQHLGARTSVRWRKYAHPGSTLDIYDTIDESLYAAIDIVTNSIQIMHAKFSNGASAPLGGACTRFDGHFYVSAADAGQWTFQGNFDDQIALEVDGRRLFTVKSNCATASGSIVLGEGWHKYDLRLGDNSSGTSGGTGGGLTDADGNICALEFSVNGGAYHAFDERYLPLAYNPGDAQKFEQPGLGGEIELAAGSTLVNAPREGGWCPVYGTLKGSGTLSGPFRFTGEENSWEMHGNASHAALDAVTFENPLSDALAGLKGVKAVFNRKPTRSGYDVTENTLGITSESAAAMRLVVKDDEGNDYSEDFTLKVQNGKLRLINAHPGGFSLFFR